MNPSVKNAPRRTKQTQHSHYLGRALTKANSYCTPARNCGKIFKTVVPCSILLRGHQKAKSAIENRSNFKQGAYSSVLCGRQKCRGHLKHCQSHSWKLSCHTAPHRDSTMASRSICPLQGHPEYLHGTCMISQLIGIETQRTLAPAPPLLSLPLIVFARCPHWRIYREKAYTTKLTEKPLNEGGRG